MMLVPFTLFRIFKIFLGPPTVSNEVTAPIISSGLHKTKYVKLGTGFKFTINTRNLSLMTVSLQSGESVYESVIRYSNESWNQYGMTWLKEQQVMKLYLNGKLVEEVKPEPTVAESVQHATNFINIAGFYDHCYAPLLFEIVEFKVWRHSLDSQDVEEIFSSPCESVSLNFFIILEIGAGVNI